MQPRLRTLFISSWFPSRVEPINGIFVLRHAQAAAKFADVTVLHAIGDPSIKKTEKTQSEEDGVKIYTAYYPQTSFSALNFLRKMYCYRMLLKEIPRPQIIHANVIHTNLLFAWILHRWYRIPMVLTEHFTDYRTINHAKLSTFQKWLVKFIGNSAERVLPVSDELGTGIRKLGVDREQVVIPNVVSPVFRYHDKAESVFTFFHLSSLTPRKNPEGIVRAFSAVVANLDAKLILAGSDDDEIQRSLKKLIIDLGLESKITLLGSLNQETVAHYMNKAHCFILFSEDENQPCVIAEAFCTGTPVISTAVGGIPEFFPGFAGFLIDQDETQLAQTMVRQIQQVKSTDYRKIADYGKDTFSAEKIAPRLKAVYYSVCHV